MIIINMGKSVPSPNLFRLQTILQNELIVALTIHVMADRVVGPHVVFCEIDKITHLVFRIRIPARVCS